MMNVNRIADSVLAAFLSAFFSWVFFFFLVGLCFVPERSDLGPAANCLGMILAFGLRAIRISGMWDGRRVWAWSAGCRLQSISLVWALAWDLAVAEDRPGRGGLSVIILMEGWVCDSAITPSSSPSSGNRITMVYTCTGHT